MSEPAITFEFDEHAGLFMPGDTIAGQYHIAADEPERIRAVELSVLWYTLGKGDEDFGVHHFQRETADEQGTFEIAGGRSFATVLPNSPLSYDGLLVKIVWCVRVRLFLRRGRDVVAEQPFQLGLLPRPQLLAAGQLDGQLEEQLDVHPKERLEGRFDGHASSAPGARAEEAEEL